MVSNEVLTCLTSSAQVEKGRGWLRCGCHTKTYKSQDERSDIVASNQDAVDTQGFSHAANGN